MNLGEMRQRIRDDLNAGGDGAAIDPFWPDRLIDRYINRAVARVRTAILQHDEDFFTRTKTVTYAGGRENLLQDMGLPAEPISFVGVWDISNETDQGIQLDHISVHEADMYSTRGDTLGPSVPGIRDGAYYLGSDQAGRRTFGYRPVSSGSRTLRVMYVPMAIELKRDIDSPEIPADFHEAVVLGATVMCCKREERPPADWEREFAAVMSNAIMTLDGRHADRETRVLVSDPELYEYGV